MLVSAIPILGACYKSWHRLSGPESRGSKGEGYPTDFGEPRGVLGTTSESWEPKRA